MWYVIQTIAGKEEKLIFQINALLTRTFYKECFVIQAEWMKRLGGEWRIQVRPLFPGYVFIETRQPDKIFLELKRVPEFSRLLGNGRFDFSAVEETEQRFLKRICGENKAGEERSGARHPWEPWLVRLSVIHIGAEGQIVRIEGPLRYFSERIERINLHKRYAVARIKLCHREQTVLFGMQPHKEEICIKNE